jgi:hypothetical protein
VEGVSGDGRETAVCRSPARRRDDVGASLPKLLGPARPRPAHRRRALGHCAGLRGSLGTEPLATRRERSSRGK